MRIVLIDGKELARLMIAHGVGVATAATYEVKKIEPETPTLVTRDRGNVEPKGG